MSNDDWDKVMDAHLTGAYSCVRAAWPHLRKQKSGRIVVNISSAGLFGEAGRCNVSAADSALVGLIQTLGKEGLKYNVLCNAISPAAATRLGQSRWPPELLPFMSPNHVAALVAVLTHSSSSETGSIFEAGGGHISKLRWQRAKGLVLKPDAFYTPAAIVRQWSNVVDYSEPDYPNGIADMMGKLEEALKLPSVVEDGKSLDFSGKVVLVTGGGAG